jgi:hypothetical protein
MKMFRIALSRSLPLWSQYLLSYLPNHFLTECSICAELRWIIINLSHTKPSQAIRFHESPDILWSWYWQKHWKSPWKGSFDKMHDLMNQSKAYTTPAPLLHCINSSKDWRQRFFEKISENALFSRKSNRKTNGTIRKYAPRASNERSCH